MPAGNQRLMTLGALLALAAALVVMLLPTWQLTWMTSQPHTEIHSWHRWTEGVVFGNGQFAPIFSLLLTAVAFVLVWLAVFGRGGVLAPAVWALAAAGIAVFGGLLLGGLAGPAVIAPVLLIVAVVLLLVQHRRRTAQRRPEAGGSVS